MTKKKYTRKMLSTPGAYAALVIPNERLAAAIESAQKSLDARFEVNCPPQIMIEAVDGFASRLYWKDGIYRIYVKALERTWEGKNPVETFTDIAGEVVRLGDRVAYSMPVFAGLKSGIVTKFGDAGNGVTIRPDDGLFDDWVYRKFEYCVKIRQKEASGG
jgi:hypothetical protein